MELMLRGVRPRCARNAFAGSGIVVVGDGTHSCRGCPLTGDRGDHGALATRLEQGGKVNGIMPVSLRKDMVADTEEQGLFREMSDDCD